MPVQILHASADPPYWCRFQDPQDCALIALEAPSGVIAAARCTVYYSGQADAAGTTTSQTGGWMKLG
jgi:hypothetical protein